VELLPHPGKGREDFGFGNLPHGTFVFAIAVVRPACPVGLASGDLAPRHAHSVSFRYVHPFARNARHDFLKSACDCAVAGAVPDSVLPCRRQFLRRRFPPGVESASSFAPDPPAECPVKSISPFFLRPSFPPETQKRPGI